MHKLLDRRQEPICDKNVDFFEIDFYFPNKNHWIAVNGEVLHLVYILQRWKNCEHFETEIKHYCGRYSSYIVDCGGWSEATRVIGQNIHLRLETSLFGNPPGSQWGPWCSLRCFGAGSQSAKRHKAAGGAERGQHCPHGPGRRLTVESKRLHHEEGKGQSHAARQRGGEVGADVAKNTGDSWKTERRWDERGWERDNFGEKHMEANKQARREWTQTLHRGHTDFQLQLMTDRQTDR